MINRNLLIFILTVSLFNRLYSFDIGLEAGVSYFNYAEVGVNNKDDLYTMRSSLVGFTFKKSLSIFELKTSLRAQVPFDLTFTDAFGEDDTNYLDTLIYFGGNLQLSLLYPILQIGSSCFYIGPLINYDYFYFEDFIVGRDDKYIYSVVGIGICLDYLYHLTSNFSISLTGSYNYNILDTWTRDGTINWSNNLLLSSGLVYSF